MKLIVRPVGGLCNRLICISSFIDYAKDLNAELTIYWIKNSELNAYFTELFKPVVPEGVSVNWIETSRQKLLYTDKVSNKLLGQRIYNKILKLVQRLFFSAAYHVIDFRELWLKGIDKSTFRAYKKVYISWWGSVGQYPFQKNLFLPREDIINGFPKIDTKYVGLHIRRTDHQEVINETPIAKYHSIIKHEISRNSSIKFYVASDNAQVKKELKSEYGKAIILLNEAEASRNTLEGMQAAMADLFTLAHAERIYGSPKSSFAVIAAKLGSCELHDIKLFKCQELLP